MAAAMITKSVKDCQGNSPDWLLSPAHHSGEIAPMLAPNRIEELRKRRGLSGPKLASAVGTSAQQIDRLEKGKRNLTDDWMRRIAAKLNCEPWELLREWGDTPSVNEEARDLPQSEGAGSRRTGQKPREVPEVTLDLIMTQIRRMERELGEVVGELRQRMRALEEREQEAGQRRARPRQARRTS